MAKDLTFSICECVVGTETERDLGGGITGIWGARCCDDDATEGGGMATGPMPPAGAPERCLCALRFDAAKWDLIGAAKWMAGNSWVIRDLRKKMALEVRRAAIDGVPMGTLTDRIASIAQGMAGWQAERLSDMIGYQWPDAEFEPIDKAITDVLVRSGVMRKIVSSGRKRFAAARRGKSAEAFPVPRPDMVILMSDGSRVDTVAAMRENALKLKEHLIREGKPLIV